MEKNKGKTLTLTLIAIAVLLLAVIGATFAFFYSRTDGIGETNVNITTKTTDVLSFNLEDKDINSDSIKDEDNENAEINIRANMSNFTQNDISVGDGVTAQATLIANDTTNSAQDNYYIYLNINKNEFKYTNFTGDDGRILEGKEENGEIVAPDETHTIKVPELILTITQPGEDGELTQIDGLDLDYKTNIGNKGINGFDITEATGLIPIVKNYEIKAEGEEPTVKTIQEWEIKVTFVNLESNQNKNTGKVFSGQLILQKEEMPTSLADVCDSNEKAGDCVKELYEKSVYNASHIIYHNNDALAESQIPNATLNANDNSYRYSGSSGEVKNYVCLDGTETTNGACASDADLYRIIGFFPNASEYEMKLIKYDYATKEELGDNLTAEVGAYRSNYIWGDSATYRGNLDNYDNIAIFYWNNTKGTSDDSGNTNIWQYSNLNKINLNDFYYNYIITKVSDLENHITEHKWVTGGFPWANYNAQLLYNTELGTGKLTTSDNKCYAEDDNSTAQICKDKDITYPDQIGLMYASDYGYAAYPKAWNYIVDSCSSTGYGVNEIITNNWMYMGLRDWTISRFTNQGFGLWGIFGSGCLDGGDFVRVNHSRGVRPTFYLDDSTKIAGGDGSKTNPFRLSWN